MCNRLLALLLAGGIGGCAASPPPPAGTPLITAVGTPLLIALKVPFCAATVVIAAPLAGISGFAPTEEASDLRHHLDVGIGQNCGPPYVLQP